MIHKYNLRVIDDDGAWSEVDTVTITTISPFAAPVANAGSDRIIAAGRDVILDGTASTVDRRRSITSYSWIRTGGTSGESIVLTDANTARPVFTANALEAGADDVTHVFELTVRDSSGESATDTVTITVEFPEAPNLPPIANAGPDQVVVPGDTVILDGSSSSDRDGTITYSWQRVQWTTGISDRLNNPNTAYPSFTAILPADFTTVTHVFKLTITDDDGAVDEDRVTITVEAPEAPEAPEPPEAPNLPPVANAGQDQIVVSSTTVQLDGRNSSDNEGEIASWSWRRTGGTPGRSVVMTDANTARPRFTTDILPVGADDVVHGFTLTVTDNDGAINTDWVWVGSRPRLQALHRMHMQGWTGWLPLEQRFDLMDVIQRLIETEI